MKVIDETSAAIKILKGDIAKLSALSLPKINEIIAHMILSLSRLELDMSKHLILTDHVLKLKVLIVKPLNLLLRKIIDMNTLKGAVISENDFKSLQNAEEAYEVTRSHVLLATVARNTEEAEMIERAVREMLEPLRQVTGLGLKDKSREKERDKTEGLSPMPAIIRSLIPLLSCPDSELLARCVTKSTIDGFSASVVELQSNINNASSPENKSASPPSKNDPKNKAAASWYDSSVNASLIGVSQFDLEYFAGIFIIRYCLMFLYIHIYVVSMF